MLRRKNPALGLGVVAAAAVSACVMGSTEGEGVGACCLPDGGCVETFESECLGAEGVFQGAGVPCSPGLCGSGCLGDLNGDEIVGFADLSILLAHWGPPLECPPFIPADLDVNCRVDRRDLEILLEAWGSCGSRGGGCCLPDGSCLDLPRLECAELEGEYSGDFLFCDLFGCFPSGIVFGEPREFTANGEPVNEAKGDFNGDGFDDVVAIISAGPGLPGAAQLFFNQGVEPGAAWIGFKPGPALVVGVEPRGVDVAFINGDSAPDIVVSNEGDNTLSLFLNNGDGTFPPAIVLEFDSFDQPSSVAAADFTGDGLVDLAVANAGSDTVTLLENMAGAATGSLFDQRQISPVGGKPGVLDPEDLDADKDLDLAVGAESGDKVWILYGGADTGGGLGGEGDVFLPAIGVPVGDEPVDLALADLDGNGLPDIIAANFGDSTLSIILVQGFNQFDLSFPPIPVGANLVSVAVADFDRDGDPDIVVVADDPFVGPGVQAIENQVGDAGFISFAMPVGFTVDADPNFVIAVDVNVDGLPDVATVNADDGPTGGSVSVLLAGLSPCLGDLNGDGRVGFFDLLALLEAFGDCPGTGACAADLNGDGFVDQSDALIMLNEWGPCPGSVG